MPTDEWVSYDSNWWGHILYMPCIQKTTAKGRCGWCSHANILSAFCSILLFKKKIFLSFFLFSFSPPPLFQWKFAENVFFIFFLSRCFLFLLWSDASVSVDFWPFPEALSSSVRTEQELSLMPYWCFCSEIQTIPDMKAKKPDDFLAFCFVWDFAFSSVFCF